MDLKLLAIYEYYLKTGRMIGEELDIAFEDNTYLYTNKVFDLLFSGQEHNINLREFLEKYK
jgi:hypothetical protein